MPPLVNFSSPLFLSHTDPPFIYQYVGDQVKIIQVLGNYPFSHNFNSNNDNSDKRDQKEAHVETHAPSITKCSGNDCNDKTKQEEATVNKDFNINIPIDIGTKDNNDDNTEEYQFSELYDDRKKILKSENYFMNDSSDPCTTKDTVSKELTPSIFFEPSSIEDDYLESNDEASFETPMSTPKSIRKNMKGKYGKNKAPPPPQLNACEGEELQSTENNEDDQTSVNSLISNKSNILRVEQKVDTIQDSNYQSPESKNMTNALDDVCKNLQGSPFTSNASLEDNSEQEKGNNDPTNSSIRTIKGNITFGKLFHLPSKLVFWHKTDEKSLIDVDLTNASRKSSVENTFDEFQSCPDLNVHTSQHDVPQIKITEMSPKDSVSGENISNDILKKSDPLQKIINEKLENHPEYKFVSLHEEIPTTSKSTDV